MASKRTDQGNDLPIPIINVPDSPRLQRINSYKPEDFPTSLSKIQSLAENESMSTDSDSALGTDDDDGQQNTADEGLETSLRDHAVPHINRQMKWFWTEKSLTLLLTKDRILKELEGYQRAKPAPFRRQTPSELTDIIFQHHRKVFAILCLLGKGALIASVMHELRDTDLPLQTPADDGKYNLYRASPQASRLVRVKSLSTSIWNTCDREAFLKYQRLISPEFLEMDQDGRTPKHMTFHDEIVLPFMRITDGECGGYGVVSKIEIHPDCHGFHNLLTSITTNNKFALKQLNKPEIEEFEREVKALKRFNGFDHKHMVTLLMSWTFEKRYYLLFPLARCDLAKHWENEPLPTSDPETTCWMLKQVVGIASALEHIHDPPSNGQVTENLPVPTNQYGRHGDLKPENILLYDSPDDPRGILVVADLGLARINSILSRSQPDGNANFTPRYKPPECDILDAKLTSDQKFEDLHDSGHCTQFFHDLLLLAEDEMMVVRAGDRSSSKVVHQKLNSMYAKMEQNSDYYKKPCTTTQRGKIQPSMRAKLQPPPPREKSVKRK